MLKLIILTLACGVGGLGIGGVIGAFAGSISDRANAMLMSFSSGTMISLICFELLGEAIETGISKWLVGLVVLAGAGIIGILDKVIDEKVDESRETFRKIEAGRNKRHTHNYVLAGLIMAAGIALHNIPEGMSIGAIYARGGNEITPALSALLVTIVMHNIPEGIAIALPLCVSGMKKAKAIGLAALSGCPTLIGAAAGYSLGAMSDIGLAVSLAFAAGTLLYVVFGEIIPTSIHHYCSRRTTFCAIAGIVVGMLVISMHAH